MLDAPAAGHAITFLQSANGLLDAVDVGPINTQARDVVEMLSDPARTQVVLVTLPEETPVNELVETAFALEDRVGVSPRAGRGQRAVPRCRRWTSRPRGGRGASPDGDAAALRGGGGVPPGPGGAAARAGGRGSASGCRSPRSTSRSCSRPASRRPTSTCSSGALVAGIGAL